MNNRIPDSRDSKLNEGRNMSKQLDECFVLVETLLDNHIYFNKEASTFYWYEGDHHSREFLDLVRMIEKEHETAFQGEFYIYDSWDGICKFTATRRLYDRYEGKYVIQGKSDRMGSNRNSFDENALYPINEHNTALLKKQKEMDSEGWKLINQAKALGSKMTRDIS